jgi:hypothetical protein
MPVVPQPSAKASTHNRGAVVILGWSVTWGCAPAATAVAATAKDHLTSAATAPTARTLPVFLNYVFLVIYVKDLIAHRN